MSHKHLRLEDFSEENAQAFNQTPDRNFSPQRNYAIIRETIEEHKKWREGIAPKVVAAAGDRADIVASWMKYKLDVGGEKKLEDWLGKHWMARIYGEKLMEKIRMLEVIEKQNVAKGNDKYKDFYLI